MQAFADRNNWLMAGVVLSVVAVFAADMVDPLGVAAGVPYVVPVVLSLGLRDRRYVPVVAASCVGLTVLGIFLSPPGSVPLRFVPTNRAYAILAITLVVVVSRLQHQLVRRNRELGS